MVAVSSSHGPMQSEARSHGAVESTEKQQIASAAFKALSQSLKKLALYLHQEEGLEHFFFAPLSEMQRYHQKFNEDLTIQIKPFDFLLDGESIYHDDGQESSITYKLYKVGIRTFTFEQKVSANDLVRLGKILIKSPMELAQEDIASLLWQEDIPHISYLQLQSVADDEGGEGDEEDQEVFEQLMAQLEVQLKSNDPRNQIHYKTLLMSDLNKNEIFSTVDSQRRLAEIQSPLPEEEQKAIQDLLAKQQEELPAKSSELLYFLMKNAATSEELKKIEEYILTLGEHLSLSYDFYHLAMLLEELLAIEEEMQQRMEGEYQRIRMEIYQRLATPEQLLNIIQYLEETTRLTVAERNDIRIYLGLLGRQIHDDLFNELLNVSSPTRRLFISVLLHSEQKEHWVPRLLELLQRKRELLLDLLIIAKEIPQTFNVRQLQDLLRHKDTQIQTEALLLLAQDYPQHVPSIAKTYLQDAHPALQRISLEVLCRVGKPGIAIVIDYLESKAFKKLKWAEKEEIYRLLGETQQTILRKYFAKTLQEKSSLFGFALEQRKKLAIIALISSGHPGDRKYLEKQLKAEHHSKAILKDIESALNRFSIDL